MTINPASLRELSDDLDVTQTGVVGILRQRCVDEAIKICMLPLALLLLSGAVAARASDLALGINYSWFKLGASTDNCRLHPASVLWQSGILPQYNNADVRPAVQAQLLSMRQSGFTTIRTFVALKWRPQKNRNEGPVASETGALSPTIKANLSAYTKDIVAAGFKSLEVSFGGVGIYCHKSHFGDCFDPSYAAKDWIFIEEVTRTVNYAAGHHMSTRFDLGNEGCPAPSMPKQTIQNATDLFVGLAIKFRTEFGDDWLISCPNSPHDQRQRLMLNALQGAGLSPRYLEIHSYSTETTGFSDVLAAANDMAKTIGATLILGEARYHSKEQADMLRTWIKQTPDSRLSELIQWPLSGPSTRCPIDTAPPYSPGLAKDISK